jgi:hypothetical protein
MSRHWEFAPHGDGTQGSTTAGALGRGGGATRTQATNAQPPQIHITHTQTHSKTKLTDTTTRDYWSDSLRGMLKHLENGSPVKPWRQLQIGLWLITSQRVFSPQGPGQGSTHF